MDGAGLRLRRGGLRLQRPARADFAETVAGRCARRCDSAAAPAGPRRLALAGARREVPVGGLCLGGTRVRTWRPESWPRPAASCPRALSCPWVGRERQREREVPVSCEGCPAPGYPLPLQHQPPPGALPSGVRWPLGPVWELLYPPDMEKLCFFLNPAPEQNSKLSVAYQQTGLQHPTALAAPVPAQPALCPARPSAQPALCPACPLPALPLCPAWPSAQPDPLPSYS